MLEQNIFEVFAIKKAVAVEYLHEDQLAGNKKLDWNIWRNVQQIN